MASSKFDMLQGSSMNLLLSMFEICPISYNFSFFEHMYDT